MTGFLMFAVISIQFLLSFIFLRTAFKQDVGYVALGFDNNIKAAVETIVSVLNENHMQYTDGVITEEEALDTAKRIVRDSRYGSSIDKTDDGYFWADMANGYCAVHYNPANEGEMRWDWVDQEGTHYIRNFIKLGDEGGGYSDFYFGKPGDEQGSYKKRGYTLKFEPYGWYISTGNYYEDIDAVLAEIEAKNNSNLLILFGTSLFTVFVGLFLVSMNLNRIVTPIIKLSERVRKLSMGDTSTEDNIVTAQHDEIEDLHDSTFKVIEILHKLLGVIHTMIIEQEKGNVDYVFKTEEFFGDYRVLADSVLELAAFGMRDQLTGIPNRRSFDNRLDLEWNRAIRDQTPVSILIIDVDKFKTYNDTFGHQQGDVALQTVANAIRQSLKRSVDFAARWGGEEFVILLVNTESEGALSVAEKVRGDVENAVIPCSEPAGNRVTVSVGVNTQIPASDSMISDFISGADHALYGAKEGGRNRSVLFDGKAEAP
ncbi:MAG: diguanylate cyclase [Oscillospiraceae bacterium]|nr:diguanylate cyclase [Oscillospiraceae bacterium]